MGRLMQPSGQLSARSSLAQSVYVNGPRRWQRQQYGGLKPDVGAGASWPGGGSYPVLRQQQQQSPVLSWMDSTQITPLGRVITTHGDEFVVRLCVRPCVRRLVARSVCMHAYMRASKRESAADERNGRAERGKWPVIYGCNRHAVD